MEDNCFWCQHDVPLDKGYYVTFYDSDTDHDEHLCDDCYSEWLQSLKG